MKIELRKISPARFLTTASAQKNLIMIRMTKPPLERSRRPFHGRSSRSSVALQLPRKSRNRPSPVAARLAFALEPVKAGHVFYSSQVLPVKEFVKLCPEKGTIPAETVHMLKVDNAGDLDRLAKHFDDDAGTLEKMSWFVGSMPSPKEHSSASFALDSLSQATAGSCIVIMSTHSIHVNHSYELCNALVCGEDGDRFVLRAVRDIAGGDEIFFDYEHFRIRTEIEEWFAKRQLLDVKTMMREFAEVSSSSTQ